MTYWMGNRQYQYSIFIFRTGLRAAHVVPVGTVLVTPELNTSSAAYCLKFLKLSVTHK